VKTPLWGIIAVVAAGCSATRYDYQECTRHSDCRSAFGFGSVCGSSGLCESALQKPLARCNTAFPSDLFTRPERYKNAIVIGSLMDRSSAPHVVRENAVRLAVKEAGAEGGYDGQPVAAVLCDLAAKSDYDAEPRGNTAVAAANFLADKLGVAAIVGPSASDDSQKVWEAMRSKNTAVISPAATSVFLLKLEPSSSDGQPGLLWRVAPPDSLQGTVIAEDMMARMVREVAVIREPGPYGDGLTEIFRDVFTAAGGTVNIHSITSDTQIGETTAMVAESGAQEVLFISSKQDWASKFLNAASGQDGYKDKGIFLTDAAANQSVLTGATAASALFPRVRGTRPAPRDAKDLVFASFVANYKAEYGGADPSTATFSHHAYDAAWLALYGSAWSLARESGVLSGVGVARGLRKVSSGAPTKIVPSSWLPVVTSFRAGTAVNLSGASGELDFDPVTRNVAAPIEIWSIDASAGPPAIAHVAIRN
jgi:branched-chain amino acid transport system substrate-binding protein